MRLLHPCSPPLKWLHQTKSQHDQCPLPERLPLLKRIDQRQPFFFRASINHTPEGTPRSPAFVFAPSHPYGVKRTNITKTNMITTQLDMDTTKSTRRAILERYLSNPTDEEWEHVKEAVYREAQQHGFHGGFPITSVAREDLETQGFDTSHITDEQMAAIADH